MPSDFLRLNKGLGARGPLRFDTSETRAPPSVLRGLDEPTLSGPQTSNRGRPMKDRWPAYGRPWTDAEIELLRRLARLELSAREIAQRTGRTSQAVKGKARCLGLTLR